MQTAALSSQGVYSPDLSQLLVIFIGIQLLPNQASISHNAGRREG